MGDDYISLVLNSAIGAYKPEVFLSLMLLSMARILPIIALSPFFGARVLAYPVKVSFALSLFVIFLPVMITNITTPLEFNVRMIFLLLKEMFIGFSIGFIVSIPFIIVQSVGIIIDNQRGGASLMVNDPTIQNQSSPIGTVYNMILIFLFFLVDGPFYVMNAIIASYEILPPDKLLAASFFKKDTSFWQIQFNLLTRVMTITAQLAAPALLIILMTDIFLGIANRLAPQVQITFLGMGLKSLLAMGIVCIGFKQYNQQTIVEVFKWFQYLKQSIQNFTPASS